MLERARTGAPAGHALAMHLAECPDCTERWEAEMELSRGMRDVRSAAMQLRPAPEMRARLMAEFDAQRRHTSIHRGLVWAMAAITMLLLAFAVKQVRWAGRAPATGLIQSASNYEVTAELMVGEDGLPRAVRVPDSVGIRY